MNNRERLLLQLELMFGDILNHLKGSNESLAVVAESIMVALYYINHTSGRMSKKTYEELLNALISKYDEYNIQEIP